MTESSQSEVLNNFMLKIQYKHESLIFFFFARRKTSPYRFLKYNAMLLNWMLVYLKYFLNNSPFPICRVYICAIFPNSVGSSPIPKTLLWNASVRFRFVLCFVLKILFEKKITVGGTRNDPFGYSKTYNSFRLISKYLLLASQTNINIILQDFLYSFGWRRHWSQWKVSFSKSSHIFWRSIISQSWLANLVQVSYVAFKLV